MRAKADMAAVPVRLPDPRGPLSERVIASLRQGPGALSASPEPENDALGGDDHHLTLFLLDELSYRRLDGVDERWEQEPSVLALRVALETAFEERLREAVNPWITANGGGPIHDRLRRLIETAPSPALSRWLEREATLEQFREFVIHRSAYHLMEADPHSFGIPRFTGAAKAALVEIQFDEYGGGREPRMHASLFRDTMLGLGLDARPGAYLDRIPGITLATVNAASMFALARRWRAALAGHLAIFEMTSCRPNRSYGNALRRLGYGAEVTRFYDEHVEADAVHELVASRKLAGAIVEEEPDLQQDVLFGAAACLTLEARAADHMLRSWKDGRSSLLP